MRTVLLARRNIAYPDRADGAQERVVCVVCGVTTTALVIAVSGKLGASIGVNDDVRWLLCPDCGSGIVQIAVEGEMVTFPAAADIRPIEGLSSSVSGAWDQAKTCFANGAYMASDMVCRTILMHVAVDKGEKKGLTFVRYVDYLTSAGYTTPSMRGWVDQIRKNGNKAVHELNLTTRERAESTLKFTEQMLRIVYEMDSMAATFS